MAETRNNSYTKSKMTKRTRERWLAHFRTNANFAAACRAVGVTRQTAERLIENNRYFAAEYERAKQEALESLEEEAWRRAKDGVPDFVVSDGRVVRYKGKPLIKRTYSDKLLHILLQANGGDKYRQKTDNNTVHKVDDETVARKLTDALARKLGVRDEEPEAGTDQGDDRGEPDS